MVTGDLDSVGDPQIEASLLSRNEFHEKAMSDEVCGWALFPCGSIYDNLEMIIRVAIVRYQLELESFFPKRMSVSAHQAAYRQNRRHYHSVKLA